MLLENVILTLRDVLFRFLFTTCYIVTSDGSSFALTILIQVIRFTLIMIEPDIGTADIARHNTFVLFV